MPGVRSLLLLAVSTLACAQTTTTTRPAPLLLSQTKMIMVFGDSFSANVRAGYTYSDDLTRIGPGVVDTTTGGSNWVQFMAKSAGLSDAVYDFAIPGSTIRTPPPAKKGGSNIPSFVDAVAVFNRSYTGPARAVQWQPETTLFIVEYGINDVVNAIDRGKKLELENVEKVYKEEVMRLYHLGARQLLLMPLPPYERAPLNQARRSKYKKMIKYYNDDFSKVVSELNESLPEASLRVWDWHASMNKVFDDAAELDFMEVHHVCPMYSEMHGYNPGMNVPACRNPLSQYVWRDQGHPTWPVHQLLGSSAYAFLNMPNPPAMSTAKRERKRQMDRKIERMIKVNAGPEKQSARADSPRRPQGASAKKSALHAHRQSVHHRRRVSH